MWNRQNRIIYELQTADELRRENQKGRQRLWEKMKGVKRVEAGLVFSLALPLLFI